DGEEVVSEKTFTDLQNQEYTLEVDQLTSGKEYQFDFSVIRGEDVVTTGKKKVSTQEVKTNFAADGGFTSFRINGALEGILENTKIAIVTEVLSGETVVKTVTNEYDSDVEELEIVVPGLDMATNYSSKVTVKYGDELLSESEEDFETYTFSVSTKDVSNNQGGLYMEGTFTSDIDPNDDLALGFYYKKATDADDAYTWMDAEMKDETTLVAVGHGLDIGVAYNVKAAVKVVSEESEEVATEVKTLDDLHGGVFVDVAATGTGDGSSWENAFTKPQDAADAANTLSEINNGATVEILFKKGEYEETLTFEKNIFIIGSYSGGKIEKIEERDIEGNSSTFIAANQVIARSLSSDNLIIDGFSFKETLVAFVSGGIKIKNCNFYGFDDSENIIGGVTDGITNYSIPLEIENCNFIYDKEKGYSFMRIRGISTILKNCNFKMLISNYFTHSPIDFSVTEYYNSKLTLSNVRFDNVITSKSKEYIWVHPSGDVVLGDISNYLDIKEGVCKTGILLDNDILFDGNHLKDIIETCNN
ncbi:hypothetical protein, partial [Flammeovirga yaeyamensis]